MSLLYTKTKIFHFKDKIDSLPMESGKIMAPIHIRIKPTNVCAHKCRYCAYRVDNLQLGKDMNERDYIPRDKMLEIIDDIIEMKVKAVTFSGGGDPFYYPYLLETAKKLAESPVQFATLTNGAKLNEELAEIFADKATWIRISIDGWDDKSYSKYRGVKDGEFTKVIKNMESFKRLNGKCYLGVSIIVDRDNAAHIYDLVKKLNDIGVDSVKVSPCIVSNDGIENNKYHQPVFDKVKEDLNRALEDLACESFEIFDSYHEVDDKFQKTYSWCPFLQILPVIGADLNIYPCQDKAYNLDEGLIGSIKNQSLKEFWFSDKNNFMKIIPSKVCDHHCVANAKNKLILEYLTADKVHIGFV